MQANYVLLELTPLQKGAKLKYCGCDAGQGYTGALLTFSTIEMSLCRRNVTVYLRFLSEHYFAI